MPLRPKLSDYRAVLFDVDGTLVDSLDAILLGISETVERWQGERPSDDSIRQLIGVPLREQMRIYGIAEGEVEAATQFAIERMEAHVHQERPFEPAIEALRIAHRNGLGTALVTSKSRAELGPFLERFAAADCVDVTVSASDVRRPKPAPDAALLACERLGVDPADALFIGDSIYDIQCALSAGNDCIAVAYGAAPGERLLAEGPHLLIETPQALLAWAESAFLQTSCP